MARINRKVPDVADLANALTLPIRPPADVLEPDEQLPIPQSAQLKVSAELLPPAPSTPSTPPPLPPLPTPPTPPTPPTAEEMGRAWRESGRHWEAVAAWLAERSAARTKQQAERFRETGRQLVAAEGRVLVLHGFGAGLFVKNGSLIVKHGRVYSDQEVADEVIPRGEHGLSALVWITNGGAGSLSIQAIKWLAQ